MRGGYRADTQRLTGRALFDLIAVAEVDNWQALTLWELVQIADAQARRRSKDRAALYCLIWNAHARRRGDRRKVSDFDGYSRAQAREEARRWRAENEEHRETLAQFITRHQRGRGK